MWGRHISGGRGGHGGRNRLRRQLLTEIGCALADNFTVIPTIEDLGTNVGTDPTPTRIGFGPNGWFFDGENSLLSFNAANMITAGLDSAEGAVIVLGTYPAASWINGDSNTLFGIYTDANNKVEIRQTLADNQLLWNYRTQGESESIIKSAFSPTTEQRFGLSWSQSAAGAAGEVKAFLEGLQEGATQSIANAWAGAISSVTIGDITGQGNMLGNIPDFIFTLGVVPSEADMLWLVTGGSTITIPELDSRIGEDDWVWVKGDQIITSDGVLHSNGDVVVSARDIWHLGGRASVAADTMYNAPVPGPELLDNPNFVNWTADNPDDWSVTGEVGNDPEVSEAATGEAHVDTPTPGGEMVNLFSTANGTRPYIAQTAFVVGNWYVVETNIDTVTTGSVNVGDIIGTFSVQYNSSGVKRLTARPGTVNLRIQSLVAATDVTAASISTKNLPRSEIYSAAAAFNSAPLTSLDMRAGITVAPDAQVGIVLTDDPSNPTESLEVYYDNSDQKVKAYHFGGAGELFSVAAAHSAGATLKLLRIGNNTQVLYNDVLIGNVTDALSAAVNKYCLLNTSSENAVEWFEVWPSAAQDLSRQVQ